MTLLALARGSYLLSWINCSLSRHELFLENTLQATQGELGIGCLATNKRNSFGSLPSDTEDNIAP